MYAAVKETPLIAAKGVQEACQAHRATQAVWPCLRARPGGRRMSSPGSASTTMTVMSSRRPFARSASCTCARQFRQMLVSPQRSLVAGNVSIRNASTCKCARACLCAQEQLLDGKTEVSDLDQAQRYHMHDVQHTIFGYCIAFLSMLATADIR